MGFRTPCRPGTKYLGCMVSDTFLHNLSVNLALDTEEQLRLAKITPSEDVINHLSEAFNQALKHIVKARKESH